MFGTNDSGDFDQFSLDGVDFGMDLVKDYGIEPTNLEGEYDMYGYDQQLGMIPEGLGLVPQGLSGYYDQMGNQYNQMGSRYNQLGGMMDTLKKPLFVVPGTTFGVSTIHLGLLAVVGYVAYTQMTGKKLGFAGL